MSCCTSVQFKCASCKIDGRWTLSAYGSGPVHPLACSQCKKVFIAGPCGRSLEKGKYEVLYRNKKNTKWIPYIKDDKKKLEVLQRGKCPECAKKLSDISDLVRRAQKREDWRMILKKSRLCKKCQNGIFGDSPVTQKFYSTRWPEELCYECRGREDDRIIHRGCNRVNVVRCFFCEKKKMFIQLSMHESRVLH